MVKSKLCVLGLAIFPALTVSYKNSNSVLGIGSKRISSVRQHLVARMGPKQTKYVVLFRFGFDQFVTSQIGYNILMVLRGGVGSGSCNAPSSAAISCIQLRLAPADLVTHNSATTTSHVVPPHEPSHPDGAVPGARQRAAPVVGGG